MANDMDLEQQEREEELKRLEEDVKNSDVALDKLNSEYEEQMDEMAEEPEQEHGKVWIFFGKLHKESWKKYNHRRVCNNGDKNHS